MQISPISSLPLRHEIFLPTLHFDNRILSISRSGYEVYRKYHHRDNSENNQAEELYPERKTLLNQCYRHFSQYEETAIYPDNYLLEVEGALEARGSGEFIPFSQRGYRF